MAIPLSQPDGYIKTTKEDGTKVITNFNFIEIGFGTNPPIYKIEEVCPSCGGNRFRFLIEGRFCVACNEKTVYLVKVDLENDDDNIKSRFDILDL